jgi:hypothetical protein
LRAVEFDPDSLVDPSLPPQVRELRLALWTIVNWILPVRLHPVAAQEFDYLALRPQLLPRAPVAGDWVLLPDSWAQVERAQWDDQGRFGARIHTVTRKAGYLEDLERAGWETFTAGDADDWVEKLTSA